MANFSFYRSVDFCSREIAMTNGNQLQLRNNEISWTTYSGIQNSK